MRRIEMAALLALALAVPAKAAIISQTYNISGSAFNAVAPFVDPLTGSFTVTFDNAADVPDTASGLIVHNLNHPAAVTITVQYRYFSALDSLLIGGSVNGVEVVASGTNDFWFLIDQVSTGTPRFRDARQTIEGAGGIPIARSGTVTLTSVETPVPEPATLALLGTGLLGLAGLRRRRPSPRA